MDILKKPKRVLGGVLLASLSAGGCAEPAPGTGTGADAGAAAGRTLEQILTAFCMKGVECTPQYYADVPSCLSMVQPYYAQVVQTDGPACLAAIDRAQQCDSALSCPDRAMSPNACGSMQMAVATACPSSDEEM